MQCKRQRSHVPAPTLRSWAAFIPAMRTLVGPRPLVMRRKADCRDFKKSESWKNVAFLTVFRAKRGTLDQTQRLERLTYKQPWEATGKGLSLPCTQIAQVPSDPACAPGARVGRTWAGPVRHTRTLRCDCLMRSNLNGTPQPTIAALCKTSRRGKGRQSIQDISRMAC